MRLKYIFIIYIFCSMIISGSDKNKTTPAIIKGKILEAGTGEPLPGTNIIIKNSNIGASADENGTFSFLSSVIGEQTLIISMVGYKPEKKKIDITPGDTLDLYVEMQKGLLETGTIVVTGTSTQSLYEESTVKTEVITKALIEKTKASNLAEALSFQTGVRVENNCQNCNFTQVRIMGFEGKYSQILIDGEPSVSSLAGVYALEHFPDEMIDQIEVVKGGGSALYGAGAIAGTINIRTKRPAYNSNKITYRAESISGTLDHKLGAVAEMVNESSTTGAFIYGSSRHRNPYDHNEDGFSELGMLNNESLGFNFFHQPVERGELKVNVHRIYEDRRGGNDFDLPKHEADITESVTHTRYGGILNWEHLISSDFNYGAHYAFSYLERDSYYGGLADDTDEARLEALNYYGFTKNMSQSAGSHINYYMDNHQLTAGIEFHTDYLEDHSVANDAYKIDDTHSELGFYLQDEASFLEDHLTVVAGARIDKSSELDNPVINPRVNVKYEAAESVNIRASFSTGFRAPVVFDEDLHIEALGGAQRVVRNSDNLKEESSVSFTLGAEYQSFINDDMALLLGATIFRTDLYDAFTIVKTGSEGNLELWERINTDGAFVQGVEFDLGFRPSNFIEFRSGWTFKMNEYNSEQEIFDGQFSKNFVRTPDVFGYFRTGADASKSLSIFGALKYTGKMTVPDEAKEIIVETEQTFWEIDLGIDWQPALLQNIGGKLSFGVKNLTNAYQEDLQTGVDRDPAYLYGPQLPRRIYASFSTSF